MRWRISTIVIATVLARSATAGFYDPDNPKLDVPKEALPFELFRDRLADVVVIADPTRASKQRQEAITRRAALKDASTSNELVRRGILSIRLRDIDAAIADLQRGRRNFWAQSALGTAFVQSGQNDDAVRYLEAAGDLKPDPWPIAAEAQAVNRVEHALRKLAQLRMAERARSGRESRELDQLFDARFVGPNGQYEAGKISPTEVAKLPPDAIATVQQLLFWLPDDTRLYWLLGELYNAHGDIDTACAILDECIGRFDTPDLKRHRQILHEAIASRPKPAESDAGWIPTTPRLLIAGAIIVPAVLVLIYFQFRQLRRRFRRSKGDPL